MIMLFTLNDKEIDIIKEISESEKGNSHNWDNFISKLYIENEQRIATIIETKLLYQYYVANDYFYHKILRGCNFFPNADSKHPPLSVEDWVREEARSIKELEPVGLDELSTDTASQASRYLSRLLDSYAVYTHKRKYAQIPPTDPADFFYAYLETPISQNSVTYQGFYINEDDIVIISKDEPDEIQVFPLETPRVNANRLINFINCMKGDFNAMIKLEDVEDTSNAFTLVISKNRPATI